VTKYMSARTTSECLYFNQLNVDINLNHIQSTSIKNVNIEEKNIFCNSW